MKHTEKESCQCEQDGGLHQCKHLIVQQVKGQAFFQCKKSFVIKRRKDGTPARNEICLRIIDGVWPQ